MCHNVAYLLFFAYKYFYKCLRIIFLCYTVFAFFYVLESALSVNIFCLFRSSKPFRIHCLPVVTILDCLLFKMRLLFAFQPYTIVINFTLITDMPF